MSSIDSLCLTDRTVPVLYAGGQAIQADRPCRRNRLFPQNPQGSLVDDRGIIARTGDPHYIEEYPWMNCSGQWDVILGLNINACCSVIDEKTVPIGKTNDANRP